MQLHLLCYFRTIAVIIEPSQNTLQTSPTSIVRTYHKKNSNCFYAINKLFPENNQSVPIVVPYDNVPVIYDPSLSGVMVLRRFFLRSDTKINLRNGTICVQGWLRLPRRKFYNTMRIYIYRWLLIGYLFFDNGVLIRNALNNYLPQFVGNK